MRKPKKAKKDPVENLLSKLQEMLLDNNMRAWWIRNNVMMAYCRKSRRLIKNDGSLSPCLDLATLEVREGFTGKGFGTRFIDGAHAINPYGFTVLENILNERFLRHLLGRGWIKLETHGPDNILYLPAGTARKS